MAARDRQLSTTPTLLRAFLSGYALLWAGTIAVALAALPFAQELRGLLHLHVPSSVGTPAVAVGIAANNAREDALPFLLALLRPRIRTPLLGDVVLGGCLAANLILAGAALGAYGPGLLARLPHMPIEWAALALALTAWRRARHGRVEACELLALALGCAALLCAAALIETYTPGS